MIVKAKYTGPMAKVIIPGTKSMIAKRDEEVSIQIIGCQVLGGCWEITEGQDKYDAHIKAIRDEQELRMKRKKDRREAAKKAAEEAAAPKKTGDRSAKKVTTAKDKKE